MYNVLSLFIHLLRGIWASDFTFDFMILILLSISWLLASAEIFSVSFNAGFSAQAPIKLCPNIFFSLLLNSFVLETKTPAGWIDGSAGKHTCCLRTGHVFGSSTHKADHNHLKLQLWEVWCPLLTSKSNRHACSAHTYVQPNTSTCKINLKEIKRLRPTGNCSIVANKLLLTSFYPLLEAVLHVLLPLFLSSL